MKSIVFLIAFLLSLSASASHYGVMCDPKVTPKMMDEMYENGEVGIENFLVTFGTNGRENVLEVKGKKQRTTSVRYNNDKGLFVIVQKNGTGPFAPGREFQVNISECSNGGARLKVYSTGGVAGRQLQTKMLCVCSEI